jgi:2,5-dichloro-2,5-cyclohexadiene-1,4-diol dehydrogenase 1
VRLALFPGDANGAHLMLNGKVIIVTGGGSGIGRAAAKLFAQAGAKVVVVDRVAEGGLSVVAEIEQDGGTAAFQQIDITVEDAVKRMVATAVSSFGRISGAFNNAGIEMKLDSFANLSSADFDRGIEINLKGCFLCMKYEIAAMCETGGGAIVNTSSAVGALGVQFAAEYVAAKHGVVGLTRAAAAEAKATGVRVNAVLPTLTNTPMIARIANSAGFVGHDEAEANLKRHTIGRFAEPEDVARAAKWLLSDESAFINGVLLPVDGGYMAR